MEKYEVIGMLVQYIQNMPLAGPRNEMTAHERDRRIHYHMAAEEILHRIIENNKNGERLFDEEPYDIISDFIDECKDRLMSMVSKGLDSNMLRDFITEATKIQTLYM